MNNLELKDYGIKIGDGDKLVVMAGLNVLEDEGLKTFSDDKVMFIDDFYELGRAHLSEFAAEWDKRIDAVQPDDTALLVYTSGTTGAVSYTHLTLPTKA